MTGDATLLRRDYRRQLGRFLDGVTTHRAPVERIRTWARATASTATRSSAPATKQNIESNEYANIVLDVIYYYEQARRAGMTPLSSSQARTLRAWVERALPAYWTHSGYLNWDTGLYLYRWHLSRYWAWSCQGLLAIATSQNFVDDDGAPVGASTSSTARWTLYERFCRALGRRPARAGQQPLRHHDQVQRRAGTSSWRASRRWLPRPCCAAWATSRPTEPPPLYAFDPQIGRLTVTTPTYNTAIVAVSNGAFPYGGIELARLFDSRQRVVSHIGGRAPAAMGIVVSDARMGSSPPPSARGYASRRAACRSS